MSSPYPTIAFFGATGGTANAALVHALQNGANVVVLARTPAKLTQQLETQGIDQSVLSSQLTIITGNALDTEAVKSTLTANKPNHIVSHIVTGLGAGPQFHFTLNPLNVITMDQPNLCSEAAQILVSTLDKVYKASPSLAQRKPKLTFVSTTGISSGPEDVPFGLRTLYHSILAVPHKDKHLMETAYRKNSSCFSGVIGLRPTLLTGGFDAAAGKGWNNIRVGREAAPVQGWSVSRADVGQWMWVNTLSSAESRKEWEGEMVSMAN